MFKAQTAQANSSLGAFSPRSWHPRTPLPSIFELGPKKQIKQES